MRSTFGSPTRHGQLSGSGASPAATHYTTNALNASSSRLSHSSPNLVRSVVFSSTTGSVMSTAAKAVQHSNRFPEKPTEEEKHRLVFEELDIKDCRKLEAANFHKVFRALSINFTAATIDDLFQRGDLSNSSFMNYSEFRNWASHYPALIDAIYSRSRELIDRTHRVNAIDNSKAILDDLGRKERVTLAAHEKAMDNLQRQQEAVAALEEECKLCANAERDRNNDLILTQRQLEHGRSDVGCREKDIFIGQEMAKRALIPLKEARKVTGGLEDQLRADEEAIEQSKAREAELQAALQDAQHQTMQLTRAHNETEAALEEKRKAEKVQQDAYDAIVAENNELANQLEHAQEVLARLLHEESEAQEALKQALANLKSSTAQRDHEESFLPALRHAVAETKAQHDTSNRALEAADAEVRRMEGELNRYLEARTETETAEHTLLEGEVRLREQRYNLDDRDAVHSSTHTTVRISSMRS